MKLKAYTFAHGPRSFWPPQFSGSDEPPFDAFAGQVACDVVADVLTSGGMVRLDRAERTLNAYERAALAVLGRHRELRVEPARSVGGDAAVLSLSVNARGRLAIRERSRPRAAFDDQSIGIGDVITNGSVISEIEALHTAWQRSEALYCARIRAATDRLSRDGGLPRALAEVTAHLDRVQSVSFYLGDRFVTLADARGRTSLPVALRERRYALWAGDDVLIFAALYLQVLAGHAACLDDFGGLMLTARDLIARVDQLAHRIANIGRATHALEGDDVFERATALSELTRL
jgi:hypothetical protein